MSNMVKCNLCGELVPKTSLYCKNCGSDLSSAGIKESPFQDNEFERAQADRLQIEQKESDEERIIGGNPNPFLDLILNVAYFGFSIGVIITIFSLNPYLDLMNRFEERFSLQDGYVLMGLWTLIAISMIKGYLVMKNGPPKPYPQGYRLKNTLLGIVFLPIFLVGVPYLFLGLPLAILVAFIALVSFFFTPYRQRKNPTVRTTRKKLPSTSRVNLLDESFSVFKPTDVSTDMFSSQNLETHNDFTIKKLNTFETTYKISYGNNREFLVVRRSSTNRMATYVIILIACLGFPVYFTFLEVLIFPMEYDFGQMAFQLLVLPSIGIILFLLLIVPNKWILIRKFSITDETGTYIGSIKGNLYFSRWKISNLRGKDEASLKLTIIGHKGEIKTKTVSITLEGDPKRTNIVDSQNNLVFSVSSLDSVYIRKQFGIETNEELDPFLVTTVSVCIIERFYRPLVKTD
ncbi:MAG: hypothetical protein ACFFFG_17985 [Candidatus Thorarchaeota archaeon]